MSIVTPESVMSRLMPARKGDHLQMLLSANDMEAVVGSEVLNGIESLESRIRKISMDKIADGVDLLGALSPTAKAQPFCYSGSDSALCFISAAFFRKFDANRDGTITAGELATGLKHMGVDFSEFIDANVSQFFSFRIRCRVTSSTSTLLFLCV